MKKIIVKKKDREDLANPHRDMSYHERLIKSKSVDLKENFCFIDFGNKYGKFKPIDETNFVKNR